MTGDPQAPGWAVRESRSATRCPGRATTGRPSVTSRDAAGPRVSVRAAVGRGKQLGAPGEALVPQAPVCRAARLEARGARAAPVPAPGSRSRFSQKPVNAPFPTAAPPPRAHQKHERTGDRGRGFLSHSELNLCRCPWPDPSLGSLGGSGEFPGSVPGLLCWRQLHPGLFHAAAVWNL